MTTPPTTRAIREIARLDDAAFLRYLDLYETAFPANERVPVSSLVRIVLNRQEGKAGNAHLLIASNDQGDVEALAHYDLVPRCQAAYLVYLAVVADKRGRGIGSEFFQAIVSRVRSEAPALQALLFEVDDPDNHQGEERDIAEKRIRFYQRLGARRIEGIRYRQTVRFYPEGVPMLLMAYPFNGTSEEETLEMAQCLFGRAVIRLGATAAL